MNTLLVLTFLVGGGPYTASADLTLPYSGSVSNGCAGFSVTNTYQPEPPSGGMARVVRCYTSGAQFQADSGFGVIGLGEDAGVMGAYPPSALSADFPLPGITPPDASIIAKGWLGGPDFGVKSQGDVVVEKGDIIFQTSAGRQMARIWPESG
jgi:hypothetical protein